MPQVDVLTIGAGGGAYPGAFMLAAAGYKVVMVDEKGVMSGNCLYEGCIPSKAVREIALAMLRKKKFQEYGILGDVKVDYKKVVAHKDWVQELRYKQHDEKLREAGENISLVKGVAEIIDARTIRVKTDEGDVIYNTKNLIIASGSDSALPPVEGKELCITSSDIFRLHPKIQDIPDTLAIVGAGYIGLETAVMFNIFGSKVEVIEMMPTILPGAVDPALADMLYKSLDPNIKIHLNSPLKRIEKIEKGVRVHYATPERVEKTVDADYVLCATGRRPVVPKGVENIPGVKVSKRGIDADESMMAGIPGVYASGDVNGQKMLAHAAIRMSMAVARNIVAGNRPVDRVDVNAIPSVIYTVPEIASVGITRTDAQKLGIPIAEVSFPLEKDAWAQIYGELEGEIRLFIDKRSSRVIGGWAIGIDAGMVINMIGLAVAKGLTARDLADFAAVHPTVFESVQKAARNAVF